MHKNNMPKKYKFAIENNSRFPSAKALSCEDEEEYDDDDFEDDDDCDICNMMDSFNQDTMPGFMTGVIEAVNNQMTLTNELTKIVVGKSTKEMNAEEVFEVFKKAALVVAEASPLKDLMKSCGKGD